MSEENKTSLAEALEELMTMLCAAQHPALRILSLLDMASESNRKDKALRLAAAEMEDGFSQIVAAACSLGQVIDELKGVRA